LVKNELDINKKLCNHIPMILDSEKIKELLKQKGLTYQDVADQCGLKCKQNVNYYLASKSIKGAEIFAKVLDVNPKDLIE